MIRSLPVLFRSRLLMASLATVAGAAGIIATGCGSSGSNPTVPVVIAAPVSLATIPAGDSVRRVVAEGNDVVFTTAHNVVRVSLGGGPATTIVTDDALYPNVLTLHSGKIATASHDGASLKFISRAIDGSNIETLTTEPGTEASASDDGDHFFIVTPNGRLITLPRSGGAPETITNTGSLATDLQVDDQRAVWTDLFDGKGRVLRRNKFITPPEPPPTDDAAIADDAGQSDAGISDDAGSEDAGADADDAGVVATGDYLRVLSTGAGEIGGVVLDDDTCIFFTDPTAHSVSMVWKDGSDTLTMTTALVHPTHLAYAPKNHTIVFSDSGTIYRMPSEIGPNGWEPPVAIAKSVGDVIDLVAIDTHVVFATANGVFVIR